MKPVMNLDEAVSDEIEDNGLYAARRGQISDLIGARKPGYNLTVLPPGRAQCPCHSHHGKEAMFLILEGAGELRCGAERLPLRRHGVIACPLRRLRGGAPDHQHPHGPDALSRPVAAGGGGDLRVPGLRQDLHRRRGARTVRMIMRAASTVDDYDREKT
jgi:hypothetical protein